MDGLNYRFRKATISRLAEKRIARTPLTVAMIMLTILITSLSLPLLLLLSEHTIAISWAICIFCTALLMILVKRTRVLILSAVIIITAITLTGSPVLPALILGSVVSVGAGAAAFCSARGVRMIPALILPILSFAISCLITSNIIVAITSLVIYVPMASLAVASRLDLRKTARIAICGGALTVIVVLSAADIIYSLYGDLTSASVVLALDDLVDSIVYLTKYAVNMMGNVEITEALLLEVRALADLMISLSFGSVCAASLVLSYFAQAIELCVLEALGQTDKLTSKARIMTASTVSAIIFVLAYIFSFTTNASADISFVAIVALNICAILAPLFIYLGLNTTLTLPRTHGFAGILLSGIIAIAAFTIPSEFFAILALVGAFAIIIARIDVWAKTHYGKGENHE